MKDDDEEEENTFGVTRYPCMPSLVALQQMRNRLHLAFLGRKLMKWTMTATGREMRRIAGEIDAIYKGFDADLRNAYILLARSRYFHPSLNQMVLENIPNKAAVLVVPSAKAVSGVKLMNYSIIETSAQNYVHLGLEKGGQTILETKKAWLELLKRLILMLQLRTSFLTVEISNRAATKKGNVLSKIVVPRINLTSKYIVSELDEKEREETFRLKRVKQKKVADRKKEELKMIQEEKEVDMTNEGNVLAFQPS
ncbi:V-type proton ATPase subunit D 1-like [Pieris rapae]|uniref:V-type proton ATPase subunit D 1-like n=1 Tax=Pieris rapae TaxID=64459 RepID=UPI001E27BD14|nr:V-type proton ATPase subunit D 1-like [Pieris rapae]